MFDKNNQIGRYFNQLQDSKKQVDKLSKYCKASPLNKIDEEKSHLENQLNHLKQMSNVQQEQFNKLQSSKFDDFAQAEGSGTFSVKEIPTSASQTPVQDFGGQDSLTNRFDPNVTQKLNSDKLNIEINSDHESDDKNQDNQFALNNMISSVSSVFSSFANVISQPGVEENRESPKNYEEKADEFHDHAQPINNKAFDKFSRSKSDMINEELDEDIDLNANWGDNDIDHDLDVIDQNQNNSNSNPKFKSLHKATTWGAPEDQIQQNDLPDDIFGDFDDILDAPKIVNQKTLGNFGQTDDLNNLETENNAWDKDIDINDIIDYEKDQPDLIDQINNQVDDINIDELEIDEEIDNQQKLDLDHDQKTTDNGFKIDTEDLDIQPESNKFDIFEEMNMKPEDQDKLENKTNIEEIKVEKIELEQTQAIQNATNSSMSESDFSIPVEVAKSKDNEFEIYEEEKIETNKAKRPDKKSSKEIVYEEYVDAGLLDYEVTNAVIPSDHADQIDQIKQIF